MRLGHIIKTARIQQEMKQVVLAKGICTPSYLSRIEQDLIEPSEEVIYLLLNKLNIDPEQIKRNHSHIEKEFQHFLKNDYKEILINRDKNFTQQKLMNLEKQNPLFEDDSLYYTYLLILLRLRLIIGEDIERCKNELETLHELNQHFNSQHMYLFQINQAIYYYLIKHPKKAIESFEEVVSIIDTITLEDWEKADLNYMIGLAYIADNRIVISIEYIKKALDYFKDHFLMKRVLDCYMLIGITYKKSGQFQEALNSYLKARQICGDFGLQGQIGIIYHNLGSLYTVMGDSEEGIHYFHKSLEQKTEDSSRLISILSLVIEYSKMNNEELVIHWCNQGISLLVKLYDTNLTMYHHHFEFYKSLHGKQGLSQDKAVQAIEYFEKLQDYRHAHKYSIALAESLFKKKKYKLAASYFKEANKYIYFDKNIQKWEEL